MFENFRELTRDNLTPSIKDDLRRIIPTCEVCRKKRSEDVHHISEVQTADGSVDLNRSSNLLLVCEDCHNNRIHGEGSISKTKQRDIVSRRSDSTKSGMNKVLSERDMAVKTDDSTLFWIGLGAICIVGGLYALHKRRIAMNTGNT